MKLASAIDNLLQLACIKITEILTLFSLCYHYLSNEWVEFSDLFYGTNSHKKLVVPNVLFDLPQVYSESPTTQSADILSPSNNPDFLSNTAPQSFHQNHPDIQTHSVHPAQPCYPDHQNHPSYSTNLLPHATYPVHHPVECVHLGCTYRPTTSSGLVVSELMSLLSLPPNLGVSVASTGTSSTNLLLLSNSFEGYKLSKVKSNPEIWVWFYNIPM